MAAKQGILFKPMKIGLTTISSRIVMGPISSNLADLNNVLSPSATEYYGSRACVPGTLLIGEATFVSAAASGTAESRAGIWTAEQIASWKAVVDSVHKAGSYIFLQLWALGRSAEWGDVVSSSAVPEEGRIVPRPLREEEIWRFVEEYATAARKGVEECGFDGVELHGGNGSLIDQFTQDVVNKREDGWGGSVEKRSRFALELTRAVCAAVGRERVGFRISPFSTYNSMGMSDATPQFLDLLEGLKGLDIAYVHLVESRIAGRVDVQAGEPLTPFIDAWAATGKPIILAGGYSSESAQVAVEEEHASKDIAIAFGRAFVKNPDLVRRMRDGIDLVA